MFCKRLQATMTVSTCQKRQKKALTYMEYEACRGCPQSEKVNAGQETDQDIVRIIREISLQSPLGLQTRLDWVPQETPVKDTEPVPYASGRSERRGFGRKKVKTRVTINTAP